MDKMLRRSLVLAILFVGCILMGKVEAATLEVPSASYATIQSAIDAAACGDTVLVHDGTYPENINFSGKAITVKSANGAASTIIDGNHSGIVVLFTSSSGSLLEGFTIKNGNNGGGWGGGIHCNSSSPTITNCIISGNASYYGGAGIYCTYSSPSITNCTISGNTGGSGGGIYSDWSSSPTITNCIITGNTAGSGGGIFSWASTPTIINCVISGNTATNNGGGFVSAQSTATIINCTITGNTATSNGGGIYLNKNTASVKNSIVWGNATDEIYVASGSITVTYSDVNQEGYAGSNGNIRQDPLFVDPEYGNFSLQETSPCIDAGTSDGAPSTDMKGDLRFDSPQVPNTGGGTYPYYDMGALEYVETGWDSVDPPSVSSNWWYLQGVHFTSATEGWAVGEVNGANTGGVLLHYLKGKWTSVTPPSVSTDWTLKAVHFTSAKDGWVVGTDIADIAHFKGVLLHYSKGKWTSVTPPSVSANWALSAIHFTSATEGWAVGYDSTNHGGVLLHYSKGKWTSVPPPPVSADWGLSAVHFSSATEGWAVGSNYEIANSRGVLLHYSGGTWALVTSPTVSSLWSLYGVRFTSATEGWAVGGDWKTGKGVLLHYSGGAWTSVPPPSVSSEWYLQGVHFTAATEGWAVGVDNTNSRGVLLHYSGGAWTSVIPRSVSLYWALSGVYFTSPTEGWAVGENDENYKAALLHYSVWPETFSSKLNVKGFASDSNPTEGECHIYPDGTFYLYEDDHGIPRYYTGTYSTAGGKSILFTLDSDGLSAMKAMLADRVTKMGANKGVTVENISFLFPNPVSFKGGLQKKTNVPSKLAIKISGTVSGLFGGVDKTMSFTYQNTIKYYSP